MCCGQQMLTNHVAVRIVFRHLSHVRAYWANCHHRHCCRRVLPMYVMRGVCCDCYAPPRCVDIVARCTNIDLRRCAGYRLCNLYYVCCTDVCYVLVVLSCECHVALADHHHRHSHCRAHHLCIDLTHCHPC